MALTEVDAARLNDNVFNTVGPFKNRIINGDMRIDQRNAGASVTPTSSDYTLDRWRAGLTASSKFSVQQSSTAPASFTKSLLVTSLSAYSVVASDQYTISQRIEGFNTADLAWGSADAQSITLSFWVRSSLTGTFGGSLRNNATNRSYPFTYSISAANTWEKKTLAIAGDTSGTWDTTTNIGILVNFGLTVGSDYNGTAGSWAGANYVSATGSTSLLGTNGATWYITGVQLEAGSVATPFERRSYGTELMLCQRYYQRLSGNNITLFGYWDASNQALTGYNFPVYFRTAPTGLAVSNVSHFLINNSTVGNLTPSSIVFSKATEALIEVIGNVSSGGSTNGKASRIFGNSASAYIEFTGAEL